MFVNTGEEEVKFPNFDIMYPCIKYYAMIKHLCFFSLVLPAESQGEIEVKDPCACETLVEFQQATMSTLDQLNQKNILYIFREVSFENTKL